MINTVFYAEARYIEKNIDRFYLIKEEDRWNGEYYLYPTWGRRNTSGKCLSLKFTSKEERDKEKNSLIKKKLRYKKSRGCAYEEIPSKLMEMSSSVQLSFPL